MLSQTMISDYSLPCVSLKSFTTSAVTICSISFSYFPVLLCSSSNYIFLLHKADTLKYFSLFNSKEFLLLSASKTSFSSMTSLPPSSASPVFGLFNKFNHFETKNSNHTQLNLFNFILTNLNHSEFVFQTTKFNPYFT